MSMQRPKSISFTEDGRREEEEEEEEEELAPSGRRAASPADNAVKSAFNAAGSGRGPQKRKLSGFTSA